MSRTDVAQLTGGQSVPYITIGIHINGDYSRGVNYGSGSNPYHYTYVERRGSSIPGFHKLTTPPPSNDYYFTKGEAWYGISNIVYGYPGPGGDITIIQGCTGQAPSAGFLAAPSETAKYDDAVGRLRLQIKEMKFNAAQFVAEREATLKTVTDTVTKLAKAFRSAKRGDLLGAARNLGLSPTDLVATRASRRRSAKALASNWLALQYGWKPLLNDIYGAAEVLGNLHAPGFPFQKARSQYRVHAEHTDRFLSGSGTFEVIYHIEVIGRFNVVYTQSMSTLPTITSLGLTNPALIAWELLPFSFVVDWFLPIGNWISQWDATAGVTFVRGSFSRSVTASTTELATTLPQHPGWLGAGQRITKANYFEYRRTKLFDFPVQVLPRFKDPTSLLHLANATALLVTAFSKHHD